jgi:hypothetical protein
VSDWKDTKVAKLTSVRHLLQKIKQRVLMCTSSSAKQPFFTTFLRRFCHMHPVFTSLDFVTIFFFFFLHSKVVSFRSTSNLEDRRTRSLYLCPPLTGWPRHTPDTGFPFRPLLRPAGLWWRYSNQPRPWKLRYIYVEIMEHDKHAVLCE